LIFPTDYRYVGVADESRPGDPIYFSTRYLIYFGDEVVIYEVEPQPGEGFMRMVRSMRPIAGGSEILVYPEKVYTRDRTRLIELATALCRGTVNTVIYQGSDEHLTFVHHAGPVGRSPTIEVLDVVPPRPSWLVSVIEDLDGAGLFGDLTLKFKSRILDLSRFDGGGRLLPLHRLGPRQVPRQGQGRRR